MWSRRRLTPFGQTQTCSFSANYSISKRLICFVSQLGLFNGLYIVHT